MVQLADRIPGDDHSLDAKGIAFVASFTGIAFVGFVLLLYTLQRLGLPGAISTKLVAAWITMSVLLLSWFGRSVSGSRFFFAARKAEAIPLGIGGCFCWISGAFILTLFSVSQQAGYILLAALVLGLALQAFLLGVPEKVGAASTLPGLLARRHTRNHVGVVCLIVCLLVITPMAVAEFEVATSLFGSLSGLSSSTSLWLVCGLALLPAMFGGWQALLLVNVCMGVWVLISMLAPALVTGFIPFLLEATAVSGGAAIKPLVLDGLPDLIDIKTPLAAITALLVFAAGFAALPQTMARTALAPSRIVAIEGIGWAGLAIFLVLSAMPLSIGLIMNNGPETDLGKVLGLSGVVAVLPYAAIFLAAFNALSVGIFVTAITVVRTVRYYRNRQPGVGSMFAVRLLILAFVGLLVTTRGLIELSPPELLLCALAIAAAGLFPVLVTGLWLPTQPAWSISAAMLAGTTGAFAAFFYGSCDIALSGAIGAGVSLVILLVGGLSVVLKTKPAVRSASPPSV